MVEPTTSTFQTLYYPKDIASNPIYQYRNVKILVKEQDTFAGAKEELVTKITTLGAEAKKTFTEIKDNGFSQGMKNVENDFPGKDIKDLSQAKTVFGFCLPLPGEMIDQQGHKWSTTESMASDVINGIVGNKYLNPLNKLSSEMAAAVGFRKPIVDPGYFQDYKGTEPRSFSLSFTLMPNNIEEAYTIINMIYYLKKYTLPTTVITGLALRSPYVFDIEIGNPYISMLTNMKGVVCTNMAVSYGVDGAMQMFADGIPKIINLSLSFTERYLVTADMY